MTTETKEPREWNFLDAYDWMKAHPDVWDVCDNDCERSGESNGICCYYQGVDHLKEFGPFAGKLRWDNGDGKPGLDDELIRWLDEHYASCGETNENTVN